jgi:hypothetical protein
VCFLLFLIFRTFFRFSLCSCYLSKLYWLKKEDTERFSKEYEWLKKEEMIIKVREATGMKISCKLEGPQKIEKLFIFHYDWFMSGVKWASQFWGHVSCLVLSLGSTTIILFLLW